VVGGLPHSIRRVRAKFSDDFIKGNPALPGRPLQSKPTWLSTFGCLATSAFFALSIARRLASRNRGDEEIRRDRRVEVLIATAY
jgi:hypothetical protein